MFKISRLMDQKPIVLYFRMKGTALDAIHDDLVRTLRKEGRCGRLDGDQIYSQRSVFRSKGSYPSEAPDVERSPVDEAILMALAEFPFPFSSVRELSRRICLPRSIVHRNLTRSLRFMVRHFRWARHFLTAGQKQIRAQMVIELLRVLSVQSTREWHDIVTMDESCIYLFSEYDLMWTAPGEIVVDREWHTVQSPKFMVTVVWNPIGFHALKALPKGCKFNAQYYTNDILVAISD
jgi:hypothetical protein